mmetsp:Transcript_23194/g.40805  ORF Transcript_23194/g.40805 Transcript_23194/m.40805 type:complete len:438 (+) Transcript_23194:97-1410(+)
MSSLLGSIFGSSDAPPDEKSNQGSGSTKRLFDTSLSLPERPNHPPAATLRREKKESTKSNSGDDGDDGFSPEENEPSNAEVKQRKKKQKRKHSNNKQEGEAESASMSKKSKSEETKQGKEHDDKVENENDDNNNKTNSSDDKNEEERTIFVGNLPLGSTTRKSLAALFKDCGPVASTRIRSVPVKGVKLPQDRAGDQKLMKKVCVNTNQIDESLKNTIQGYVVFKNVDSVTKALEKNNVVVVDGMRIRVDRATPTVDPARSVFVGGLPYGAEESSLQEHFAKGCGMEVGDIEGVRIVRDKETFQCKGFGYVLLREKTMVPIALKMHESTYMNKTTRVLVCGKRFKGKKGQQGAAKPKYKASQEKEKVTIGAFRRIIAKQQKEAVQTQRKRGEKKKPTAAKAGGGRLSKRAAIDKKVEKKVKKLQKRISKGMGKTKRG